MFTLCAMTCDRRTAAGALRPHAGREREREREREKFWKPQTLNPIYPYNSPMTPFLKVPLILRNPPYYPRAGLMDREPLLQTS